MTKGATLKGGTGWPVGVVGNEGPSTFTGWYIGDETSLKFPKGQLVQGRGHPVENLRLAK